MTGVSIALLVIYGSDVAVGGGTGEGFLGPDQESGRNAMAEAGPLIGVGAFIVAIGAIKLKKSKPSSN